jgi:hypothetical protein
VRKWQKQKVVAVAVEAITKVSVKAVVVEVLAGPAKRASAPVVAEIMPLQKAND